MLNRMQDCIHHRTDDILKDVGLCSPRKEEVHYHCDYPQRGGCVPLSRILEIRDQDGRLVTAAEFLIDEPLLRHGIQWKKYEPGKMALRMNLKVQHKLNDAIVVRAIDVVDVVEDVTKALVEYSLSDHSIPWKNGEINMYKHLKKARRRNPIWNWMSQSYAS